MGLAGWAEARVAAGWLSQRDLPPPLNLTGERICHQRFAAIDAEGTFGGVEFPAGGTYLRRIFGRGPIGLDSGEFNFLNEFGQNFIGIAVLALHQRP